MPHRITATSLRVSTCRLVLALVRGIAEEYLQVEAFGTNADEVVLCCAILVGQAERRPMTAAKLADYAGMPRPTVVRKLRTMNARGLIHMVGNAATLPIDRVNALTPAFIRQVFGPHINRVATELSKMDARLIAPEK